MKYILLCTGLATGSLLSGEARALSSPSLWPTPEDRAICDPIFSKLSEADRSGERGTLLVQAQTDASRQSAPQTAKQPENVNKSDKPDEAKLATELTAMLQACSYDGKALKVNPGALKAAPDLDGMTAVGDIMRYTGLPQNFTIMEGDVPNAAAIIVMGKDGVPHRVIAYNRDFMRQVASNTGEAVWPGTSILAHEIGHHLSGHTLLPGGSQPPIELEADKFSGFVLFKMGATLPQAEKAIATLIPEADGPTHPGRKKRLAAVEAGWLESCGQQRETCGDDTIVAAAEPRPPSISVQVQPQSTAPVPAPAATAPAPTSATTTTTAAAPEDTGAVPLPDIPGPTDIAMPDLGKLRGGEAEAVPKPPVIDHVPKLAADTTPSKFDRFVFDEVGVFDPVVRDKLQKTAFQFAAATNIEIVTIIARDLQGRDPDQYALDVMRQLRVGKLDVGNGAVLVVSPATKDVGVALGPGLLVQYDSVDALKGNLQGFLKVVDGGGKPQAASSLIADASYRIMRDTKSLEWFVRFPSLNEFQAADARNKAERQKTGVPFDPVKDPTFRKLLRVDATIVSKAPDMKDPKLMVNEPRARHVGPAIQVRTQDGKDAILYVNRSVPALMPVSLTEGKRYAFIARDTVLETGAAQLDLISYDLLE